MSFLNTINNKCALVIGINYEGKQGAELNGCINDTIKVKNFLKSRCNYKDEEIDLLTDNTSVKPTKQNIINSINRLVSRVKSTNSKEVWFSYSGHGSYLSSYAGVEEVDNQDEALVPLDYDTSGLIRDDTLHDILVKKLPQDCNLFCIIDACHSGTALDLPYIYRTDTGLKTQVSKEPEANIVKISGCRDSQTSADAYINGKYQGAMTFSFLKTMDELDFNFSCKQLISRLKVYLNENGYPQIPTLTMSKKHLLDEIAMGDSNPVFQNTNVNLFLQGDSWCKSESTWNILSLSNNQLLFSSDKKFFSRNEKINYKLNLTPGRYILLLKDSYGDGGIIGNIKYNNGKELKSFNFNKGTYQSIEFEIVNNFDNISTEFKDVKINVACDYYGLSESRWNIIDSIGNKVFPEDKIFSKSFEKQTETIQLTKGNYKFKCEDDYGDGGIEGTVMNISDDKECLNFNWNNLDWSKHNGKLKFYDFKV